MAEEATVAAEEEGTEVVVAATAEVVAVTAAAAVAMATAAATATGLHPGDTTTTAATEAIGEGTAEEGADTTKGDGRRLRLSGPACVKTDFPSFSLFHAGLHRGTETGALQAGTDFVTSPKMPILLCRFDEVRQRPAAGHECC